MSSKLKFIDLFCGVGGFRYAIEAAAKKNGYTAQCMLSSDIDKPCQDVYEHNFGERPLGDITLISESEVPDHDILLAGFPCQPFSIIGQMKGFEDTRGTLFFEIARVLAEKKPKAFVLENVKLLVGHNQGKTMERIMSTLNSLGYKAYYKVFNALNFGLPQKRERVFIVGFKENLNFQWPEPNYKMKSLDDILEKNIDTKYYVSDRIRQKRLEKQSVTKETTIWHENKSGNISAYPYSCALRAGASYNYLLVNGERRLTSREMLRLQGFPDSFKITCCYTQARKQAGNSLPVPVAEAVISKLLYAMKNAQINDEYSSIDNQYVLFDGEDKYNAKTKT
jgi:DNA (cytosine-5)-methyltransferase 1